MVFRSSSTTVACAGLLGFVALTASDAWAISCDEVANMVSVNVPEDIVVQTMRDSGTTFTDADVACLQKAGVSPRIMDQARAMLPKTTAPTTTPAVGATGAAATGMSQDEDILGAKSSKKHGTIDATDEIGDKGTGPAKLEEAKQQLHANKPLSASLLLYQMLEEGAYPESEVQIYYYLGGSLLQLEMYHTAQYYFAKAVKQGGPSSAYFSYALPKLVAIAQVTGDNSELLRLVDDIPPDSFPRAARNNLNYLLGIQRYEKDDLAGASKYFGEVSTKSSMYLKAKYFEGVISNQQEKQKQAVRAFIEVYNADPGQVTPEESAEVDRLKDLSVLNVARIYYSIQDFPKATQYYEGVSRNSEYWAEALFENGWAYFMQNDLNKSLGELLTVRSSFFKDDEFLPEATILEALTYFNLCEYPEVEHTLLRFEDKYRPMADELKGFVQSYATPEGKQMADQAFDYYFGEKKVDSVLPKSLFRRALRDQDLAALVSHMDLMDKEEAKIDLQKEQWRNSVGAKLKEIIAKDRQRYKRKAGLLFLSEMARTYQYLQDLLTQSEIIRFEVVDAQRVDYQYKMQNTELANSAENVDLDFATAKDIIYWPFNGEFWQDELGYYQYTEQSSCN
jgi:hypothetical protein